MKIWNVEDWEVKKTFNGHASLLRDIIVIDDNTFINASNDYSINIRSLSDGSVRTLLKGHTSFVTALILLENGDIASGSWDKTIKIWNVEDGTVKKNINGAYKRSNLFSITQKW